LLEICLHHFKKNASGIKCIINGVDSKKFDFRLRSQVKKTDFGFTGEEIIVSYVARFDKEQKDHSTLLKAWQIVAGKIPNARLCLAGDGEGKADAGQFVENNELGRSVFFLGIFLMLMNCLL
jgi:glycosyltransferase EpsF